MSLSAVVRVDDRGYDNGVISAVLINLHEDLSHNRPTKEQELIMSIGSDGILVGVIMAGLLADNRGRKFGIYAGCFMFLIGSRLQAAAFSVAQMTVGRFVMGLGDESAAMIIIHPSAPPSPACEAAGFGVVGHHYREKWACIFPALHPAIDQCLAVG
ncbi:uncharacterized protein BCR38DRAFT_481714 [Pseudomassariella vexata]|uniref:Major facilitator superfamily (MFS) profile domain-containing protein n=1 Tax=Pseudomassariella vexata TaxID=1141098 RepID=A0A1Y2E9H8_9PEZI|nr:uncharacterized protein BCR38DRAFT_481714 [Pseudomassariella vexata]ORY68230.1 hypothetical protein BCR38DRAFT_481714 [Pseudomassariella vexata]